MAGKALEIRKLDVYALFPAEKRFMDRKKLDEYHVTGSIHTLSVKSPGQVEIDPNVARCIDAAYSSRTDRTTSIINPNKLIGDLFKYSEFETAFESILAASRINDYSIVRADMRFDNYDPDHYRRYAKLNRYLISLLAVQYRVENCYRTTNLFNQRQLSVAIKNRYFEIENYDKDAESHGKDPAKSRLEERSKAWKDKDLQQEFTGSWFDRWDKSLTDQNIERVQKTYNDELEKLYKEDKNAFPTRFRSLTDFLLQYQDCIFSRKQLINLLGRFEEVQNPVTRSKNHKQKYGIEFFSKSDLKAAVAEIKRATEEFYRT